MELPLPIELPWKLAATTQHLLPDGPADTTLALYYYQPTLESIAADYPDDYLVYLKFTVSISPISIVILGKSLVDLFSGGLPVYGFLLDLTVTPNPARNGGFRPFFLSAAPLRRAMIETGMIGVEQYEGEANGVAVGKSASQLHESGSSHADTTTSGVSGSNSWALGSLGFSTQDTSTTTSFDRSVTQRVDTTQRMASEERRELTSHHTNVENVLSLLDAKHLGSPYLRFMLRPRPLRALAADPGDPNLWYHQFLTRRSSGLEGIQEFFAVIAVPRGTNFCIEAHAVRFGVLDIPPTPPKRGDFGAPSGISAETRMHRFLSTIYPPGTPLEELDVDIMPPEDAPTLLRPAIGGWMVHTHNVVALVLSTTTTWQNLTVRWYPYKTRDEVWRDMVVWEYERELSRSPLDRHSPFAIDLKLDTCFRRRASGEIEVANFELEKVQVYDPDIASAESASADDAVVHRQSTARREQTRRVMNWNAAERRVFQQLAGMSARDLRGRPLTGPRIVDAVLRRWSALRTDDSANRPLTAQDPMTGLDAATVRRLRASGIVDLLGLAAAILGAVDIDEHNARQKALLDRLSKRDRCALDGMTFMSAPISAAQARSLRDSIARRLLLPEGRTRRSRA